MNVFDLNDDVLRVPMSAQIVAHHAVNDNGSVHAPNQFQSQPIPHPISQQEAYYVQLAGQQQRVTPSQQAAPPYSTSYATTPCAQYAPSTLAAPQYVHPFLYAAPSQPRCDHMQQFQHVPASQTMQQSRNTQQSENLRQSTNSQPTSLSLPSSTQNRRRTHDKPMHCDELDERDDSDDEDDEAFINFVEETKRKKVQKPAQRRKTKHRKITQRLFDVFCLILWIAISIQRGGRSAIMEYAEQNEHAINKEQIVEAGQYWQRKGYMKKWGNGGYVIVEDLLRENIDKKKADPVIAGLVAKYGPFQFDGADDDSVDDDDEFMAGLTQKGNASQVQNMYVSVCKDTMFFFSVLHNTQILLPSTYIILT